MEKLKVGIPVMVSSRAEVAAFIAAKHRLEALTDSTELPMEVGAFLYLNDAEMTKLKEGLDNQRLAQLPIFHVQAPIYRRNSLAFTSHEEAIHGGKSQLEVVIDHAARMRDASGMNPHAPLVVETHPGVIVFSHLDVSNPFPATYSLNYFEKHRMHIADNMRMRFAHLKQHAAKRGLTFSVENGCAVTLEPDRWDPQKTPRFHYLPFNDLESLRMIANIRLSTSYERFLTFDIAHMAVSQNVTRQFRENDAQKEVETLSRVYNVPELKPAGDTYRLNPGMLQAGLDDAAVLHFSNASGIGVKLDNASDLAAKWGSDGGTGGLLSRQQMRHALQYARGAQIPAIFELAYDIEAIPVNKYSEVDFCLSQLGYLDQ